MSSNFSLQVELSKKTSVWGLRLWVLIGIGVGAFIVLILCILSTWILFRRKTRRSVNVDKYSLSQIPHDSKDITVDKVGVNPTHDQVESVSVHVHDNAANDKNSVSDKLFVHLSKSSDPDNVSRCSSVYHHDRGLSLMSIEDGHFGPVKKQYTVTASPLAGLPEVSHLGWGHWFTLRDLELSTNRFAGENVIGEGGYGVVYKGRLINGSEVAVKRLFNNL